MPREYYNITRPKKSTNLPNVLSEEEVIKILNQPSNIKHRAILHTIYGSGLRVGEVIRLRVHDVRSDDGYLFIKDSKGKKDRHTVLSPHLLKLLREYYREHKPSYWLFEGQNGGQYSPRSIQNIFRKAVKETGANPWSTPHTFRHSFARSEEHTSELQSRPHLVCRLLLETYRHHRYLHSFPTRRSSDLPHLLKLLREYYREHKPSYWLFEGQNGGQYSPRSIQNIFRKAVKETGANPWSTPHTFRHSFATHLMQRGVNIRYIQSALGHASTKTKEVYTRILGINNKTLKSPLDSLYESTIFDENK